VGFEFALLGPLAVSRDGVVVPIRAARQRALLACLLVQANRTVSADALIEGIWGVEPPRVARNDLQILVSRLRRVLGCADRPAPLVTVPGGYQLNVPDDGLDVYRFHQFVRQARESVDQPQEAARLFALALGLWRGEPLVDVPSDRLHQGYVPAWGEQRLAVVEERIDTELRLGQHADLIAELRELTDLHPLRERFWAQRMLALWRSARSAEALDCYRTISGMLDDELGVCPGRALEDLHLRMLRSDPGLSPSARDHVIVGGPTTRPTVPRQLPARPPWFVGRQDELAALTARVELSVARSTTAISAISGTGGIGKSWLAIRWAHDHVDRFPDGQLFADLHGYSPAEPAVVLRGFLGALGVPAAAVPDDLDASAGLYRSVLAGRRMVVVLDNAHDSAQVVPLLPGSPTCTVLVTGRDRMDGLATRYGAQQLGLWALDERSAGQLVTTRLGRPQPAGLVDSCAGHPLALSILCDRLATGGTLALDELCDPATRLDVLDSDDPAASVPATLSSSYRALTAEQADAFRLLGVAPGADIGVAAAARLTDRTERAAATILRGLERLSLVQQHAPGRYRMHDLVRLYAVDRARHDQPRAQVAAALRRIGDVPRTGYRPPTTSWPVSETIQRCGPRDRPINGWRATSPAAG
jgi:DNA-binding SARP family transcriptional activator